MASLYTRQKIIDAAVQCFNREGIANIRLQHIADEAAISVGNMTYHYRNKEAIVLAIWEQLLHQQRDLLAEFRILPLFEDINLLLASIFGLQQQYQFFYIDTLEVLRIYPEIATTHQQHIAWQILQMESAIQFNQSRGAFRPIEEPGGEKYLAGLFWMVADQWRYRQSVLLSQTEDFPVFRSMLWALFQPHFSDMGKREFEQLDDLVYI